MKIPNNRIRCYMYPWCRSLSLFRNLSSPNGAASTQQGGRHLHPACYVGTIVGDSALYQPSREIMDRERGALPLYFLDKGVKLLLDHEAKLKNAAQSM